MQAQQLWLTGPVAPQHVGSSQTRARTRVPCIGRQTLNHCATREALKAILKAKVGEAQHQILRPVKLKEFSQCDIDASLPSLGATLFLAETFFTPRRVQHHAVLGCSFPTWKPFSPYSGSNTSHPAFILLSPTVMSSSPYSGLTPMAGCPMCDVPLILL